MILTILGVIYLGFPPGFNISLPPPGIRPPFPNLGAPAAITNEADSDDMDIEMEIVPTSQPAVPRDERHRERDERHRGSDERHRGSEERQRGGDERQRTRESRWNREEKTSKSDVTREKNDVGSKQECRTIWVTNVSKVLTSSAGSYQKIT